MRVFVLLLVVSLVAAAETRLRSSQLPSSLRRAIEKRFPRSEILEAYQDREDGKTTYEVVVKDKGDVYIVVGDSQEILEVADAEEDPGDEIPISELSSAVRRAAERSITGAKIAEAYEIKDPDGTFYRVIVETRRGEYSLVLDRAGTLLEREKLDDRDEDDDKPLESNDAWKAVERGRELQLARAPSSFRRNALAAVKGKLEKVYELKRDGEKYYEFHVQAEDGVHRLILDRKGKLAHTIAPKAEAKDKGEKAGE
jgi:hypothetical protein